MTTIFITRDTMRFTLYSMTERSPSLARPPSQPRHPFIPCPPPIQPPSPLPRSIVRGDIIVFNDRISSPNEFERTRWPATVSGRGSSRVCTRRLVMHMFKRWREKSTKVEKCVRICAEGEIKLNTRVKIRTKKMHENVIVEKPNRDKHFLLKYKQKLKLTVHPVIKLRCLI